MNPVIFTDPFSGIEILHLLVDGARLGVAYDPRSTALPTPWSTKCRHCAGGRQHKISIHTKREIQLLLSQQPTTHKRLPALQYQMPTNTSPTKLVHWTSRNASHAQIYKTIDGVFHCLDASLKPHSTGITYEGNRRLFQTRLQQRCLRFLFSARNATRDEVIACLRPLCDLQRASKPRRGRRNPCAKIDWLSIVGALP